MEVDLTYQIYENQRSTDFNVARSVEPARQYK